MLLVLAMALMVAPLVVLFVCEQAAKRGRGPLAEPDRMPVLSAPSVPAVVSAPAPPSELVFSGARDAEGCAAESRLVRGLLDGTLDRARYHTEMAALAGATVALPDEPPDGRSR